LFKIGKLIALVGDASHSQFNLYGFGENNIILEVTTLMEHLTNTYNSNDQNYMKAIDTYSVDMSEREKGYKSREKELFESCERDLDVNSMIDFMLNRFNDSSNEIHMGCENKF